MTTIRTKAVPKTTVQTVRTLFAEFRDHKRAEVEEKELHEALRPDLLEGVRILGTTDDKGSQILDIGEPIDGFSRLQRQRKAPTKFNRTQAEAIAARKKILPQVSTATAEIPGHLIAKVRAALKEAGLENEVEIGEPTLVQDKFFAFHLTNKSKLTKAEIDSTLEIDETFALVPLK